MTTTEPFRGFIVPAAGAAESSQHSPSHQAHPSMRRLDFRDSSAVTCWRRGIASREVRAPLRAAPTAGARFLLLGTSKAAAEAEAARPIFVSAVRIRLSAWLSRVAAAVAEEAADPTVPRKRPLAVQAAIPAWPAQVVLRRRLPSEVAAAHRAPAEPAV